MFEYTGQETTYDEWKARNQPMKPRRYYTHDTTTGRTTRDPSKERDGDPSAKPYEVIGTE